MGGRHRQSAAWMSSRSSRGTVLGSTSVVLLLSGVLVYGAGTLARRPVEPDQPRRSASASVRDRPSGTPTLAMPVPATPGANMRQREPAPRPTRARTSAETSAAEPADTEAAKRARRKREQDTRPTPRVRRSGDCVVIEYRGRTRTYCPDRDDRPRR